MATNVPITGDTPITIKLTINEKVNKKLKLPLRDLQADTLLPKLRQILSIPPDTEARFERFSDSSGGYVALDTNNPSVFKTLVRAAKAKLKLRLKATVDMDESQEEAAIDQANELAAQLPEVPKDPIIARSPQQPTCLLRRPGAFDGHHIGQGIFEFKDAREGRPSVSIRPSDQDEAPLPMPFTFFQQETGKNDLALRLKSPTESAKSTPIWSVYCNECDKAMENEHYHCSICDGGDYDLCNDCVEGGKLCPGEGHWLIRRFVKDGQVVSSTTERLAPRSLSTKAGIAQTAPAAAPVKEGPATIPGVEALKTLLCSTEPSRTCNSCVCVQSEDQFVNCNVCADFDLCLRCHADNRHGHHPAHSFSPAAAGSKLTLMQEHLLPAGRNMRHFAICDGCNKNIYGIRHKCFSCPDFDYCNECIKGARTTHPLHRFASVYEPIPVSHKHKALHQGIYCDGPSCLSKSHQKFIQGIRYKCVICHDTDFCEDCEALPGSFHNKTHPLIKIKQPIKGLNVSTVNETSDGKLQPGLGDKQRQPSAASQPLMAPLCPVKNPIPSTVSMKTVADIKPSPVLPRQKVSATSIGRTPTKSAVTLNAHFVRDSVPDGFSVTPNTRFTQVWTLRNPGPETWPAGSSVRYIGGDNMLNIDNNHASSASEVAEATESNVVGREVLPGEEVAFSVVMKAPARAGKAISYWRLKAADGTPFGHRLWCDITVEDAAHKTEIISPSAVSKASIEVPGVSPSAQRNVDLSPAAASHLAFLQQQQQRFQQHLLRQRSMAMAAGSDTLSKNAFKPPTPVTPAAHSYYTQHQERMKAMLESQMQRIQTQLENVSPSGLNSTALATSSSNGPSEAKIETSKVSTPQPESTQGSAAKAVAEAAQAPQAEKAKFGNMVFPLLEKESPANSTYQSMESIASNKGKAAYVEDEVTGAKTSAVTSRPASDDASVISTESSDIMAAHDDYEDVADEIEVFSADGDMSDEDGFLTDDEYDILDASDQETVASLK